MRIIALTQGQEAWVDDEDWPKLARYRWHAHRQTNGLYYAERSSRNRRGKHARTTKMHHVILNAPKGSHVRFKDGNGLNCQKENLILVKDKPKPIIIQPAASQPSQVQGELQLMSQEVYIIMRNVWTALQGSTIKGTPMEVYTDKEVAGKRLETLQTISSSIKFWIEPVPLDKYVAQSFHVTLELDGLRWIAIPCAEPENVGFTRRGTILGGNPRWVWPKVDALSAEEAISKCKAEAVELLKGEPSV